MRKVLFWNVVIGVIGTFLNYAFAMRWNLELGISDLTYIYSTSVIFGSLSTALSILPIMALFAKITPKKVEGTVFAFLSGTANLDSAIL